MAEQEGPDSKLIRPGVNAVIWDNNGEEIILVRHAYGDMKWATPGGAIHAGESLLNCAKRESKEETGLTITIQSMIANLSLRKCVSTLTCFNSSVISGKVKPQNPKEIMDISWFNQSQVEELHQRNLIQPAQFYLVQIAFGGFGDIIYEWNNKQVIESWKRSSR